MGAEHVDDSDMDSEVWAVEEGGFWSHHPATGTVSQGETRWEALESLREAVDLYLEEFHETSPH